MIQELHHFLFRFSQFKLVSRVLIVAELFDLATTAWGLYLLPQLWETNPLLTIAGSWTVTILVKLLVTIVVVAVLEGVECWPAMVSLVPIVATIPGVWNLFSMALEVVSRVK